jgi:hypothetical protein
MGSELSRAELLSSELSDREYFEKFFLLFSDKVDAYRNYDMTVYRYVVNNLDILLMLCRKTSNVEFVQTCCDSQGEYFSLEVFSRLREVSDLVEWLCVEYSQTCSDTALPLLLQHPVFYVNPPLELVLKNLERMARWKKRYDAVLHAIDQQSDPFTQKFFFAYRCDTLAEKIKMIQ